MMQEKDTAIYYVQINVSTRQTDCFRVELPTDMEIDDIDEIGGRIHEAMDGSEFSSGHCEFSHASGELAQDQESPADIIITGKDESGLIFAKNNGEDADDERQFTKEALLVEIENLIKRIAEVDNSTFSDALVDAYEYLAQFS
jgi:hypothetical protein